VEKRKRLKGEILLSGDVVLSTAPQKLSAAIRFVTKSDVSHALLCVGPYSAVDATADGVHSHNTQRLLFDSTQPLYVLRSKVPLSSETLLAIADFARGKVGTRYSIVDALKVSTRTAPKASRQQFCSRLVAQAYASAGIDLVPNPDFCSPEDIKNSPLLTKVCGATENVSDSLVAAISASEDVPLHMQSVTSMALAQIREIKPSIEGLNDVIQFLRKNPSFDLSFLAAFRDSGYLVAWQVEVKSKPWQYIYEVFDQSEETDGEKKSYCQNVIEQYDGEVRRFEISHANLKEYLQEAELVTFEALNEINLKMISLLRQRLELAERWLNTNN